MSKLLGTFLNELAVKAGIPADDAGLQDLLKNSELAKISIPPTLLPALESKIYNLESAKSKLKEELKTQHFAEAYNGLDAEMDDFISTEQLDDTTKAALKAEKSTPKRAILLAKTIKDLTAKAASAKTPAEKQQLIDEINTLKAQRAADVAAEKAKAEQIKNQYSARFIDQAIDGMLKEYAIAERKDLPKSDILKLAKLKWAEKIAADGGKIVEEENGAVKIVSAKDGADFYDPKDNTKKDLKSYMDGFMTVNNFLKASDSSAEGSKTEQVIVPGSGVSNGSFQSALDASIEDAKRSG